MLFSQRLAERRRARHRARAASAQRLAAVEGRQWDLVLNGVVEGRLIPEIASRPPTGNGWLFWHIIWTDGSTNHPGTEDYGPDWPTLDELDAGMFTEVVTAELRPSAYGHLEVCREQTFTVREVPAHLHLERNPNTQGRNRRSTPWHPALTQSTSPEADGPRDD